MFIVLFTMNCFQTGHKGIMFFRHHQTFTEKISLKTHFFLPVSKKERFFQHLFTFLVNEKLNSGTLQTESAVPFSENLITVIQTGTTSRQISRMNNSNIIHLQWGQTTILHLINRCSNSCFHHHSIVTSRIMTAKTLSTVFHILDIITMPNPAHGVQF